MGRVEGAGKDGNGEMMVFYSWDNVHRELREALNHNAEIVSD